MNHEWRKTWKAAVETLLGYGVSNVGPRWLRIVFDGLYQITAFVYTHRLGAIWHSHPSPLQLFSSFLGGTKCLLFTLH
jgi:hypothetical protein